MSVLSQLGRQTTVAVLAVAVTVAAGANVRSDQLPSLGNPSSQVFSADKSKRLGSEVVGQLRARGLILDDQQLTDYIRHVGNRLLAHTEKNDQSFKFYVIDRDVMNSFALPGGNVGIFTGLITETDNESELASVMAHEIAHVTQHHIAREQMESKDTTWTTLAAVMVAAIAGASTGNGDAVPAAITGGMTHLMQQRASFTRAHEYEADRVGMRDLAASEFDPKAMAQFFEKLQRKDRVYNNDLPKVFLTHPVPSTRIAEAESRAVEYKNVTVHNDPVYPLMRERARVLQTSHLDDLLDYYRGQRHKPSHPPCADYGYALVLLRLGHPGKAANVLRGQAKAHPDQPPWQLALAQAETQLGQHHAAVERLHRVVKQHDNNRAAKLAYATALLHASQPARARDFLLSQPRLLDTTAESQQILADAAGHENNLGEAYFRRARYFAMRQQYARAINQLRSGLQAGDLDASAQSRLDAYRKQIALRCNREFGTDRCRRAVQSEIDAQTPN